MFTRRRRNAHQPAPRQLADLLDRAVSGQPLELPGAAGSGLAQVRELSGDSAIEASIIRNVVTGLSKPDPPQPLDPRGLHIIGAYVRGPLDLDGVTAPVGLRFTGCRFDQPLRLRGATLPWLTLEACVAPGMLAARAVIGMVSLVRCDVTGDDPGGAVQLDAARLASGLDLSGSRLSGSAGPALSAPGMKIGDGDAGLGAVLDGLSAWGQASGTGAVRLAGAKIGGSLLMRGAWLTNARGPALDADGITVRGDVRLARDEAGTEFKATGAASHGTVLIQGGSISGQLSLEGARISSVSAWDCGPAAPPGAGRPGGPGLAAAGRWAAQDPAAQDPAAQRRRSRGAVCLSGSTVSGDLILRNAVLDGGPVAALMAENLTVKGHAAACDSRGMGFRATGAGPLGAVCLAGAGITGQLALRGTTLVNETGPALLADLLSVGEGMLLDEDFAATGAGESGAVRLSDAKINGDFRLNGACLANDTGPALRADALSVQGDLMMAAAVAPGGGFTAAGSGRLGTVLLRGASVGGQLSLEGACVLHDRGPAGPDPGAVMAALGRWMRNAIERNHPASLDVVGDILAAGPGKDAGTAASLGAVCLTGMAVGGPLVLRGAQMRNATGPALRADYLTARSDAGLCEQPGQGLVAVGAGPLGAACLAGATISGQLSLRDSVLASLSGPALVADFAAIQGDVLLDLGFTAVGTGPHGAMAITDATVARRLSCAGWLVSPVRSGQPARGARDPALNLSRTKVGTLQLGSASPRAGFSAAGVFRLSDLSYATLPQLGTPALLDPRPGARPREPHWRRRRGRRGDPERHGAQVAQWLYWLRYWTPRYEGQPYAALAAAYGAAGHDDLARVILVAQREDLRVRGQLSGVRRAAQLGARWLIGYGYHSFYAFLWLLGLLAAAAAVAVFWFGPARYIQPVATLSPASAAAASPGAGTPAASGSPSAAGTGAARCSVTGRLGYALVLAFPVIDLTSGAAGQCDVPASGAEPGVLAFGWVVRALAATLFVLYGLGLSGVTRSPPGTS